MGVLRCAPTLNGVTGNCGKAGWVAASCTSCGKVEEFYDPEIEKRQHAVAKAKGWLVQDHTMALYGQCADCAKKG